MFGGWDFEKKTIKFNINVSPWLLPYDGIVPGLGGVDGMKSSPGGVGGGGPGTPREDSGSGMGDYNLSEYLF